MVRLSAAQTSNGRDSNKKGVLFVHLPRSREGAYLLAMKLAS